MLLIYVWKTESVQHLETVETSAIVLDDTYKEFMIGDLSQQRV